MAGTLTRMKSLEAIRFMCGICPDIQCHTKLYFPLHDKSVECTQCGQRHEQSTLKDVAEVTNPEIALHNLLKNALLDGVKPKRGSDDVKVLGLSNYVCKIVSPILTYYGIDKETRKAKRLSLMGKGEVFDISVLGDRAFLIDEEHLKVIGYGEDRSGSSVYLADTLKVISIYNDNETRLVPIHADGDGHCLVHAISRALVGRELFWHPLRVNLKQHMVKNLQKYQYLFKDFVDNDEWEAIINECDPYYIPPDGEGVGLRNIHIFGLANVLHRPIILLDSQGGLSCSGDYSGVFLPGLVSPDDCKGKDGTLNKPLCIAWSSSGRNHYIPLVSIKGRALAKLPNDMVQKSWGMPQEEIQKYIEFDQLNRCTVGGDKCLKNQYLRQLVSTMEEVFIERYHVNPNLVADVHKYIFKSAGFVSVPPDEVIEKTEKSVEAKQLYRCLMCDGLMALEDHTRAIYTYDETNNCLIIDTQPLSSTRSCMFCPSGMLRHVAADGSIMYENGDRTATPCVGGRCPCGFRHFWEGKEYDNLPEIIPIDVQWGGKSFKEEIAWFQYESNKELCSNVFEVAQNLVQKHFPGEFGSERLVQQVVDKLLSYTNANQKQSNEKSTEESGDGHVNWSAEAETKIILTGPKKTTIHKEELVKSKKEKDVRKNIQSNAQKMQQKKTVEIAAQKSHQPKPQVTKTATSTSLGPSSVNFSGSVQNSGEKKVRLQTSDGRQAMLTVVKDITYAQLQKLIYEAVGVPGERQKIRIGFPPRLLEVPSESLEEKIVPLNHGDKIALEILPNMESQAMEEEDGLSMEARRSSCNSSKEDLPNMTVEKLLDTLKEMPHGVDSIAIASLSVIKALTGEDLWTCVQGIPHLFSVGGLFYDQVKRHQGLVDGKHYQLPYLPEKIFCYNAQEDRLDLCVEPYGHFAVEPHVELKYKNMNIDVSQDEVKFGTSGAIHHNHDRTVFHGQGHSLTASDIIMPGDVKCAGHSPRVPGLPDLGSDHSEPISEEVPHEMHLQDSDQANPSPEYQRLGPAYSVLFGAFSSNENICNLDIFNTEKHHVEKALSEIEDHRDEHCIYSASDSVCTTIDDTLIKPDMDFKIANTTNNAADQSMDTHIIDLAVEERFRDIAESKNQSNDTEMEISDDKMNISEIALTIVKPEDIAKCAENYCIEAVEDIAEKDEVKYLGLDNIDKVECSDKQNNQCLDEAANELDCDMDVGDEIESERDVMDTGKGLNSDHFKMV